MTVYKNLKSAPNASIHPHAARWYRHITSYESEHSSLPGDSSKTVEHYGSEASTSAAKAAPAAAAEEDDDEVDLFGDDDDEVDEEAERIKAERLAEYAAKKAKKPKTIAKVRSPQL